jgi:hypothetical protein
MYLASRLLVIVDFKPLVHAIIDDEIAHLQKRGANQIITRHILIKDSHLDLIHFIHDLEFKLASFPLRFLAHVD